jgi:hypothetical protein
MLSFAPKHSDYRCRDNDKMLVHIQMQPEPSVGLDDRGSVPGRDKRFSLLHSDETSSGPVQSAVCWVLGSLSLKVKRLEREAGQPRRLQLCLNVPYVYIMA